MAHYNKRKRFRKGSMVVLSDYSGKEIVATIRSDRGKGHPIFLSLKSNQLGFAVTPSRVRRLTRKDRIKFSIEKMISNY
jgi:hypothetical protein